MEKEIKKEVLCECKCPEHKEVKPDYKPDSINLVVGLFSAFLLCVCLSFSKDLFGKNNSVLRNFLDAYEERDLLGLFTNLLMLMLFLLLMSFFSLMLLPAISDFL